MAFNTLALMLGYRCNIQCRSCLWGDLHSHGPAMEVAEARGWIDEACRACDIRLVGFSGGESFLYLRQLRDLAGYCWSRHNLPSAVSTNGYWALNESKAEAMLRPLAELGLRELLLSVDDFHQEHIPLERIGHALRAARRLGIECTLQAVVTRTSRHIRAYMEDLGVTEEPGLRATEVFCTRMGWAASRIPAAEFPPRPGALSSYCSMLGPLIVRPEGTVHLCCGPAFAIPGLTVGNLRQERLADILQRAEWDPLFNALALGKGPSRLVECLRQTGRGDLIRDGYSFSCEACHDLLSVSGMDVLLREQLAPQQAELFLKRSILSQESVESLSAMVPV
jgi:MoaA/NifB/PqqE/SkfB family radical SAM enzyme